MNAVDPNIPCEQPALTVSGLDLDVGGRRLIEGLSLRVERGERWAIMGQNGSGKSTLCRVLAGLQTASSRQTAAEPVAWFGRPLSALEPLQRARLRAYMAQDQHHVFGLSVLQTVLLARYPFGRNWESVADLDAARQALHRMDAEHLAARDIRTLSGGERQRVALAAALAQDAPLMLLDEPINHLDLPHQIALAALLKNEAAAHGKTVLLVAHDINWAARFADRVLLIMPDGRWSAGPVSEVMREDRLTLCLGYPVTRIEHEGQNVWIPVRAR